MDEPLNSASIVAELSAPKAGATAREQAKVKSCFCHVNTHEVTFFHQTLIN
jgi:hypothetical protein